MGGRPQRGGQGRCAGLCASSVHRAHAKPLTPSAPGRRIHSLVSRLPPPPPPRRFAAHQQAHLVAGVAVPLQLRRLLRQCAPELWRPARPERRCGAGQGRLRHPPPPRCRDLQLCGGRPPVPPGKQQHSGVGAARRHGMSAGPLWHNGCLRETASAGVATAAAPPGTRCRPTPLTQHTWPDGCLCPPPPPPLCRTTWATRSPCPAAACSTCQQAPASPTVR